MAVTVIAGLASAGGAWAAAGFTAMNFFAVAGAFAIGAGLSLVSRALIGKPSFAAGSALKGTGVTVREPDATRKLIYGRVRVGGAIVFLDSSGTDNKYMNLVIAIAGHEVDGIEEIWFNDELIWDGSFKANWADFVSFNFHDGSQTTADADLVAESIKWTTDHILNDTAYLYVKMEYDVEQFAQGMPNISALIRGKKIYNPVTDVTEWTQNSALCVYDYLVDSKYGLSESASSVNLASLTQAVALCSDQVDLGGGQSHDRYTLNGVIDTGNSRKDNMEAMLTSMAGNLIYSGGEYFISGASYAAPTVTFDESVLVGGIEVQTKQSRRGLYNGVKGVFLSEEDNYIVADYPAQISSQYSLEDGDPVYLDMALPFTTNNVRAQRIAKLALLRSRKQTAISMPCNLAALKVKAGDNINVSNAKMGWSNKPFEVIGYELTFDASGSIIVNVNAIETAAEIYDWQSSDAIDYLNSGELAIYDGKQAAAPQNLIATPSSTVNADGTVTPSIDLSWTASVDAFVDQYIVEWTNTTSGSGVFSSNTNKNTFSVAPVVPNNSYNISVYAINGLGVKSTALTGSATAVADAAPNLPSIYKIVTDSSDAPTAQQFLDSSGRNPKNNDYAITSDTTTDPDTTYAWRYDLSTSSWVSDSYLISGDLIVTGSINTQLLTVGVNESLQSADTALQDSDTGVNLGLTGGSIAGITISPTAIYSGAGNFNNADTGFYLGSDSRFSLDNKLSFNPSTDTLTVDGAIKAINLDLTGNATIAGSLTATGIVYGGVTLDMLNQEVIDSFQTYVAQASGGTPGDYETGSATAPATITLGDFTHGEQPVEITVTANNTGYHYVNYTTADLTANYVVERAVSGTTTWSSVGSGVMVFSQYDLTEYYPDTYYHSLGHTNTITDDPADGTYTYRLRFTSYGSAWSSIGPSVSLSANENGTGVTSTGGNADTLDYLDSTQFMRSDANTSTSGNLTVGGDLTVNGTTVTLNTATLDVEDKNITLNFGAGDTSASANGAGITIQDAVNSSTDASILWNTSTDTFNFSNGIDVTGTATMDGLSVDGNASTTGVLTLGNAGIANAFINSADSLYINIDSNNDQAGGNDFQIGRNSTGTSSEKIFLAGENGDISFYEDTGATPKFFWDASAESLGIGTNSPNAKIDVYTTAANYAAKIKNFNGTDAGNGLWIDTRWNTAGNRPLKITSNNEGTSIFEVTGNGNIGIGTSSPNEALHVYNATTNVLANFESGDAKAFISFKDNSTTNTDTVFLGADGNNMAFYAGSASTERMRIDSSGNLLVGKSSANNTTQGTTIYGATAPGAASFVRDAGNTLILNRLTNYGEILAFRKDGTTVGSIGIESGGFYLDGEAGHSGLSFGGNSVVPRDNGARVDNQIALGSTAHRFTDLYLSGASTAGSYQVNGTTVIDSSRNLTNISNAYLTSGGALHTYTSSGSLRGYIGAVESGGGTAAGLVIATSGGETISFKDGGLSGTLNAEITGGGDLNLITGTLDINGTTVIDSSRNLTNIGTIGATDIYTTTINTGTPWTSANDGSGSGLDADLLDGLQGSQYLRSDVGGRIDNGTLNVPLGYISYGNPWGTDNSAYFPNGITTAGSTNWIYGTTYLGNAPSNGSGCLAEANGNFTATNGVYTSTFYDRNNTAYYADPANTSAFYQATFARATFNKPVGASGTDATTVVLKQSGAADISFGSYPASWTSALQIQNNTNTDFIWISPLDDGYSARFRTSGSGLDFYTDGAIDGGTYSAFIGSGSVRSPLFYDLDNTIYYVDPNGTSSLNTVNISGGGSHFGVHYFNSNLGQYSGSLSNPAMQAYASSGNSAFMSFHRGGYYAVNMGLDADNVLRIGGWSASANRFELDMSGHLTVAGSSRAPIFYDSNNTGYYFDGSSSGTSVRIAGDILCDANYGKGMVGVYTSTRLQHVWSMGAAYRIAADGTTAGNMYGLAWSHPNAGSVGGANNLNDHGLLLINNGSFRAAISSRAVFSADVRGTLFYDYNDTGYYVDPHNVSNFRVLQVQAYSSTSYSTPNILSYGSSNSAGVANYHIKFMAANGTANGYISTNYYGTTYATTSDHRIKEDLQPMVDATSRLMALNPVNFQWKGSSIRVDGFIAHEVAEIVYDAVVGEKDAVDDKGNDQLQALDQSKLIPLLVKTIQEQQGVIDALEARISALEA